MPTVPAGTGASSDPDNRLTYGSDASYYVAPESVDTVSYTCAGGIKKTLSDVVELIRSFAGCGTNQPLRGDGKEISGWRAVAHKAAEVSRPLPDGTTVTFDPEALCLYFDTTMGAAPASLTVTLPLAALGGTANVTIDWGDGSPIQTVTTAGNVAHAYAKHGRYMVEIFGSLTTFGNTTTPAGYDKLLACLSFGRVGLTSLASAFSGCANLLAAPTVLPDTVTILTRTFNRCWAFNQHLGTWDVSRVTLMDYTFSDCASFNQPLSNWQTENVTTMQGMFNGCRVFNQPLGGWNVAKVTNFNFMFYDCVSYNQSLNAWDTASATSMNGMFTNCLIFNQPLSNWKMGNVTTATFMFSYCAAFNQPLAAWDVSKLSLPRGMFAFARAFNQPLNAWNTISFTDTNQMFFGATAFNQPLSNWKMGSVTIAYSMFLDAKAFNQPIEAWDTSKIANMNTILMGCDAFNQSLGGWSLAAVTQSNNFMVGNWAYTTARYDATLVAWNNKKLGPPAWPTGLVLNFGYAGSSTAGGGLAAKTALQAYGWTIVDAGNVG